MVLTAGILLCFLSVPGQIFAQDCIYNIEEIYLECLDPTVDVWKPLIDRHSPVFQNLSPNQRFQARQIPSELLKEISTKGLALTCFQYGGRHLWRFLDSSLPIDKHGNENLGVNKNFNGFIELNLRPDAGTELFFLYKNLISISSTEGWDYETLVSYYMDLYFVECWLASQSIINTLSAAELSELISICTANHERRSKEGCYSIITINVLLAKLLTVNCLNQLEALSEWEVFSKFLENPNTFGYAGLESMSVPLNSVANDCN